MSKNPKNKKGLTILGILFLGVIIILVISYFNINLRGVVESPTGQDNINYVKDTSTSFWDKYLAQPASYLWNDVWVDLFWRPFIDNMKKIEAGKPTVFDKAAPQAMDPNEAQLNNQ